MIRSSARAEQKERTREHLYATSMALFERRGYEQVNVDDIVRAAEVSRGTFYFHFPTKEDVLVESIRRGEALILERIAALPPSARLRKLPKPRVADTARLVPLAYTVFAILGALGVMLIWADIVNPVAIG